MEYDNRYASAGKGNAALTTGIIGTAGVGLGLAANVVNALAGNNGARTHGCAEAAMANGLEISMLRELINRDMEIAYLKGRDASKSDDLEMYKYFDGKLEGVNARLCEQAVWNATQTATIGCIAQQVAALNGLTKLVVPNTSVCPGWGNVTITPSTTTG